jgi:hypothetical protein
MTSLQLYALIAAAVCLVMYLWRRRTRLSRED